MSSSSLSSTLAHPHRTHSMPTPSITKWLNKTKLRPWGLSLITHSREPNPQREEYSEVDWPFLEHIIYTEQYSCGRKAATPEKSETDISPNGILTCFWPTSWRPCEGLLDLFVSTCALHCAVKAMILTHFERWGDAMPSRVACRGLNWVCPNN